MTKPWTAPPLWSVPKVWAGQRCYILACGESVRQYRDQIPTLTGPVIAIKESLLLRPDPDIWFLSGEDCFENCCDLFPLFTGGEIVARGRSDERFPMTTKRIGRTTDPAHLSDDPTQVCGFDAGTSAINLAYLFGATEIVLLGYDMVGGRWATGLRPHTLPQPPEAQFRTHLGPLPALAAQLDAKGVKVWNTSPCSRAPFPYRSLSEVA